MAMTWKSLQLLKQNLGETAGSVMNYLENRAKTRQQEQLFKDVEGRYGQFKAANPNVDIGQLRDYFAGGQVTPEGAQNLYQTMRKATVPGVELRSSEGNILGIPTKGGLPTGEQAKSLYTAPAQPAGIPKSVGTEDSAIFTKLGIDATKPLSRDDAAKYLTEKLQMVSGRTQATQTAQEPFTQARETRAIATKKKGETARAIELGKEFAPLDTQIGSLEYNLGIRPVIDQETGEAKPGQFVDAEGQPADPKRYISYSNRKSVEAKLQGFRTQKTRLEEDLRKAKAGAAGQPIGQAQTIKMPFGDVTIEELPRG